MKVTALSQVAQGIFGFCNDEYIQKSSVDGPVQPDVDDAIWAGWWTQ